MRDFCDCISVSSIVSLFKVRLKPKWMLKYGIFSHNGIGVIIVSPVYSSYDECISDMFLTFQFKIRNVCIFDIESKSLRQLFYTPNP